MTILNIGNNILGGESGDTKPTNYATNTIFYEFNTGAIYRWTGSSWVHHTPGILLSNEFKETITINKTAEDTTSEVLQNWKMDDDSDSLLTIDNISGLDAQFVPRLLAKQEVANDVEVFTIEAETDSSLDTGVVPIFSINVRRSDPSTIGDAIGFRPLFAVKNDETMVFQLTSAGDADFNNNSLINAQTLDNEFAFRSSDNDQSYIVRTSAIVADRDITFPLLTGDDIFVFEAHTQVLTNKTISGANNILVDLVDELDQIGDVEINTILQNGDLLTWMTDKWVNMPLELDAISNVNIGTDLAVGHVLTFDGNEWINAEPTGGGGGEANTASNVGTAGIGIFKQKVSVDLQFKKLNAGSTKITITDDTGNDEVDIDVAQANLSLNDIGGSITTRSKIPSELVYTDESNTYGAFDQIFPHTRLHLGDSDASHVYIFAGSNLAANRTVTLPLLAGNDTFVMETFTQTLTNKTISGSSNTLSDIANSSLVQITDKAKLHSSLVYTDQTNTFGDFAQQFRSGKLELRDSDNSHSYILTGSDLVANRTVTFPLLAGNDTLVLEAFAQTLTNKTIAAGSNTISGIVDANIDTHTSSKITITTKGQLNNAIVYTDQANTYGAFDQTFKDSTMKIRNPADTFSYTIAGSAITADRTIMLPAITGLDVLMTTALTQNVTGAKSFFNNALKINNPANTRSYTFASSAIANSVTVTLPDLVASDTFAFAAHTQTLSNKTMTTPKFDTNTTGGGSAALGANSPAITNSAPYTWLTVISSDGSTVYIPCWK